MFIGPISAALAGQVMVGIALSVAGLVVFDTDRPWWPADVKQLPGEPEWTRRELRKLNLWSGAALLGGVAVAGALWPGTR